MRRTYGIVLVWWVFFAVVVTACDGEQEQASEEVTQAATVTETRVEKEDHADSEAVIEGLELFRRVGCADCHGRDGEGGSGPAMASRSAEQVRRQVRAPDKHVVPPFSEEQLSDEGLNRIITWVESLGPATGVQEQD